MTIDQRMIDQKYTDKTPETLGGFVALEENTKNVVKGSPSQKDMAADNTETSITIKRSGLPELLAPAGSPKALRAAVNAGADAVYFALPDFNARINADNFTRESFAEGVELCHRNGVKAYITLNTQVYDREMESFLESALYAYRSGVDAAIVGDLGCAAMIRKYIPELELHASTQLSAHNCAAAEKLAKLGFSRVVLARELSCNDIKKFTESSELEAEIFIHGALCVCHSGQCLFSSLVGGRSGNRGLCAQPCRLPYKMRKGESYPLSLKDMCLAEHIPEIIETGVSSLKIEGRMKPADYVYGVVSIYRKLLDERRSATKEEMALLEAIFSRNGFTDGYFTRRIDKKMLGVRTERDKEKSRNVSFDIEKKIRRIGINISVAIKRNQPMNLTLSLVEEAKKRLKRDINITVEGDIPFEALKRPIDSESARKNLVKFGETPYEVEDITIDIDEGLMVPVSSLNSLRRKASEALADKIVEPYKGRNEYTAKEYCFKDAIGVAYSEDNTNQMLQNAKCDAEKATMRRTASFVALEQIPDNANEYFDLIFVPVTLLSVENAETIKKKGVKGITLPPVIFDSEITKIEDLLTYAPSAGIEYALVGNLGHLGLVEKCGLTPVGDFRLNVSSCATASAIGEIYGIERLMLSPELTVPRVRDISKFYPSSFIAYGRVPLMIVEKCLICQLTPCAYSEKQGEFCRTCRENKARLCDRTGAEFPVIREFEHRNIILNSIPTYTADKQAGLPPEDQLTRHFIFTVETAEEAARVIEDYKNKAAPTTPVRRMGV